jgi:sugar lactone lactonase YvrE
VTALRKRVGTGLAVSAAALALTVPATAFGGSGRIQGQVQGGTSFPRPLRVTLFQAAPGKTRPVVLGSTLARRDGGFDLRYRGSTPRRAVRYLVAGRLGGAAEAGYPAPPTAYRLASALGAGRIPRRATIDEATTVAMAYSMAQFFHGNRVAGKNPGLRNAAAMTTNLVGRRGSLSRVLRSFPNGRSTTTLRTFDSLANLTAACRQPDWRCARFLHLGAAPGSKVPAPNTLRALVSIATNPWHDVRGLLRLSHQVRPVYGPALTRDERPPAWTLALRFEGDGESMNGPGNFAIDAGGSLWVANNYEFSRERLKPVCAAENLLRFTPTGRYYPGSPYTGGGLTGAGFGIGIDPFNHVWVGNFGFAAPECPEQPPHNSVSEFTLSGEALSPDLTGKGTESEKGGFEQGSISWPQGTVSDRKGNIWIANCGNNSVTRYTQGNPEVATNLGEGLIGLQKPFGVAVNGNEEVFVTGNENSKVAVIGPSGIPVRSPIEGGGLNRPMGIAVDSRGYVWVANSGKVPAPCPVQLENLTPEKGSAILIKPNGELARTQPIEGAGMTTPWGIAVDGDDNVWVANFSGQRLSELCGTRPKLCPPGKRSTGASISPRKAGYGFDGLVRNTGVAVDPSGNVWLTNNWKQAAIQANPGGYQIVAFLGLAAPVKAPLIGPPERP